MNAFPITTALVIVALLILLALFAIPPCVWALRQCGRAGLWIVSTLFAVFGFGVDCLVDWWDYWLNCD